MANTAGAYFREGLPGQRMSFGILPIEVEVGPVTSATAASASGSWPVAQFGLWVAEFAVEVSWSGGVPSDMGATFASASLTLGSHGEISSAHTQPWAMAGSSLFTFGHPGLTVVAVPGQTFYFGVHAVSPGDTFPITVRGAFRARLLASS